MPKLLIAIAILVGLMQRTFLKLHYVYCTLIAVNSRSMILYNVYNMTLGLHFYIRQKYMYTPLQAARCAVIFLSPDCPVGGCQVV